MADDNVIRFPDHPPPPGALARANSWISFYCPICPNAHVILVDRDGVPMVEFIVGPDQLATFVHDVTLSFMRQGEAMP
jgi:hypothetical protein